ncbi:MFS transporter, partial [Streptococcus merionis]|uniref:MFS transporter n=1 Tax=Streptococcus merionis TaxID=400065 RepID=UPI0026E9EAF8
MQKLFYSPKHKNIVLGIMFSNMGTIAYTTALSLYILKVTGSVIALSFSLLLNTLPIILTSLISGIVADRFNKLKIIVRMDTLRIFLGLILFLAMFSVHDTKNTISLIYLQIVIFAILETFQTSSYQAILPDV